MINRNRVESKKSFFQRLRSDIAGNTLAMVGAGLVPMAGIIGSGVDLSRAYMVKTRLQQACDAGVLAGRRAMGDGSYSTSAQSQTQKFFDANFPVDYLDTTNRTFTPLSSGGGSAVIATASATLPTIIMKMFGNDDIDISVECSAILEIANSDVTMVLDSTGSMACPASSSSSECSTYFSSYGAVENQNGTSSRMAALRTAMISFNGIVDAAASGTGARIRYAMVPYTGSVNVGELLYDANKEWLVGGTAGDTYQYQTRQGLWTKLSSSGTLQLVETTYEFLATVDSPECTDDFGDNQPVAGYWNPNSRSHSTTGDQYFTGNPITVGDNEYRFSFHSWNDSTAIPDPSLTGNSWWLNCERRVDRYAPVESFNIYEPGTTFQGWTYGQYALAVDELVDSIKTSNPATINPASETGATVRWEGCIQERDTLANNAIVFNGASGKITPAGALDLDIDSAPTSNNNTKWRPDWNDVAYYRTAGTTTATTGTKAQQNGCPTQAQLLSEMTTTEFSDYATALKADGATYHDIGMLWGARLSSEEGIFATNVTDTPTNGGYVSRHLIFMTDGQLDTSDRYPSAYGIERHDGLIAAGDSTQASANHRTRFLAICDAVRAKGIRLWVIAFGTTLNADMTTCASANSSFESDNATELNDAFITIAQSVSDLRLSQ